MSDEHHGSDPRRGGPAKLAQKDRDARWTVKYSKSKQPIETPTSATTMQHAIPMSATKTMPASTDAHGFIRGMDCDECKRP